MHSSYKAHFRFMASVYLWYYKTAAADGWI